MKTMIKLALVLALALGGAPARAAQNTTVAPVVGPHTMAEVMAIVNAAFVSVVSTHSGSSAPANSTGSAPQTYQLWLDTSTTPRTLRMYDGASWVALGTLNTSTHAFVPTAADLGVATGTSLALNGCTIGSNKLCATGTANISGATTIGGALTYGGVTLSNAVTGTGNMVLASSPSIGSPTFTGTVAGSNTIPLTILAQSAANTMLGNWTGSTANVAANAMPSCSDSSGNHLNYVSGTGVTCGTSTGAAAAGSLTGGTLAAGVTASSLTSLGTIASLSAGTISATGVATILSGTAIPAGGTAGSGYKFFSTSNFGTFGGSGAPTLSVAQGSLYLRSDGAAGSRAYINTNGTTGYVALADVNVTSLSSLATVGTLTGGATGAGFTVDLAASTISGTLGLANGGAGGALTASNGGVVYSDASRLQLLAGTVTAGQCLLSGSSAAPTWGSCSGAAAVSSVSATDSTLTISPTTGSVLAGINLANANAWTAAQTIASTSANAFAVGRNGSTNPAFSVDASTASSATGLNIKSAAAAGGVAVSVISSGTNENLTLDAKGSGTITIGGTSTGAVTIARALTGSAAITATTTMTTGANGGTGGQLTLNGSTSGSGVLKVAAAAGSGIVFQLPSANGSANNFLQTNGSGVTSWAAAVTSVTCGTGLTGGAITSTGTCAADIMSASNLWTATSSKLADAATINSAGALTALTDAATVAVDMALGVNYSLTIGGNRTLGAPSNTQVGRTGCIFITQDGTGSRTLAYNANWKFAGGTDPVLSTAAGAIDMLCYIVRTSTSIVASLTKDVK